MVDGLRRALGFLTVYPLRASDAWTPETLGSSMVYYPLVGTFIGLALWGLAVLLGVLFPPSIVSVLLLVGSLLVTGGLHMDGWADLRPALVLMGTLSRYAMVQLACFSPYARATGGIGEPFVRGIRLEHHIAALLLALGSTLLFGGLRGVCIGVLVSLATFGMQLYFYQRLGGITGDVLGATNELNEALVLLLATVVY